jgi:hypothetical protein
MTKLEHSAGNSVMASRGRRPLTALSRFGARLHREQGSRQWVLEMPLAETCDLRTCGVTAQLLARLSEHLQDRVVVRLTAPGTRHEFVIRPRRAESAQEPAHGELPTPDDGPLIRAYLKAAYMSDPGASLHHDMLGESRS